MKPKETGEISEALVLAHLMQSGYAVSIPFGNNQRYDLVLEIEQGKFETAQVKTGRIRRGCVVFFPCSSSSVTYKKRDYRGQVDWFLVYCPDNSKFYKIAVNAVGKRGCYLRVSEPKKFGNMSTIRWAKDYEI